MRGVFTSFVLPSFENMFVLLLPEPIWGTAGEELKLQILCRNGLLTAQFYRSLCHFRKALGYGPIKNMARYSNSTLLASLPTGSVLFQLFPTCRQMSRPSRTIHEISRSV